MKTSAILGLIAVGALVAVAGLAVASGAASSALGLSDGPPQGLTAQGDGKGACGGRQTQAMNEYQWRYQNQLSEPQQNATFQVCTEHSYGWSYGNETVCPEGCGSSCHDYDWDYSYAEPGPHGQ